MSLRTKSLVIELIKELESEIGNTMAYRFEHNGWKISLVKEKQKAQGKII